MRKCGKTLYSRAGHARKYSTAHAHCILDTKGYKHTLSIRNTYCFSTTTMVALTRLKVSYTYIACLVSIPEGFTCSSLKFPMKKVTKVTANSIDTHLISLSCYELSLLHNTTRVYFRKLSFETKGRSNYKVYAYIVRHNYVLGGMLFTICKAQLHVSAKCWPSSGCTMKTYRSDIHASLEGV